MIELVNNKDNKFDEFEFIIINYYKFHKDNILTNINEWYQLIEDKDKSKFKISIDKFIYLSSLL